MTIDIPAADAATVLDRVPVCIGCHRPATGRGRVRLRAARPGVTPPGGDDLIAGLVLAASVAADAAARAKADAVTVGYPACWRHRWINRPHLTLEALGGGRAVLGGASPAFAAAWAARTDSDRTPP